MNVSHDRRIEPVRFEHPGNGDDGALLPWIHERVVRGKDRTDRGNVMARPLEEIAAVIGRLDAKIRPVAGRAVDLSGPGALADLTAGPHPLDETGTRDEVERLLAEIIDAYLEADPGWRSGARDLFRRHDAFAWAATLPLDRRTEDGFLANLVLFSLDDQGRDPRDARLWLSDLCDAARRGGLEVGDPLRRVAALSSDEDRHGWGSTRRWLAESAEQDG